MQAEESAPEADTSADVADSATSETSDTTA